MIYDKLSFYYDELVKDVQATQAWVNWIMDSVSSPCELLDLACGSAEISILLAKNGFQVSALDLSQGMIQAAKEKDKKHKIQFFVHTILGEQSVLPLFSEDFLSPAFDFRHRSGAGKCKKEQSICWTSSL